MSRVTEILCSFRLVLEGKTGKGMDIKIRVLRKVLLDADDNTSKPMNRGGIVDLPLLKILGICEKS